MNRLVFYLQYAGRNLWRSRRWSAFAVFSVAAGVATVVALRSLGLAIGDSLTSNLRATNKGDITLIKGGGFFNIGDPEDQDMFSERQLQRAQEWVAARGGSMTAYTSSANIQITALDANTVGRPQFIDTFFIDPATYPPTDHIHTIDPPDAALRDLFQGGNEVIISQNLAESQDIQVGDSVRVSGTDEEFVVRGIVPTEVEAGFRNLFSAFFGFAYFDRTLKDKLPVPSQPNRISVILPEDTPPEEIVAAASQLENAMGPDMGFTRISTVPQLLEQNRRIAEIASSFIVVMGLGALLIGGVGIINTMLVMVRRRTEEIAALKTFGLKGRQVAALFMSEAMLLGFAGSLLGGAFGVLLSGAANVYGTALIQQPLTWRFHPEAVLFGLALGMVVSMVFGVVPVLTAVRVRPAIILRPNETYIPGIGILQALGAIMIVVIVIGVIAGQILAPTFSAVPGRISRSIDLSNPTMVGIIVVGVTLAILGLLVGLLWLLVWLVGKLPSFGLVDLRLALRNLTTRRTRTATTLLALSAGMFALSSISFFGAGAREILQFTLGQALGGNVLIFPLLPSQIARSLIDNKLDKLEGVNYRTRLQNFSGEVKSVDGQRLDDTVGSLSRRELNRQINEAARAGDTARVQQLTQLMDNQFRYRSLRVAVRDTDNPALTSGTLADGRDLTLDDRGQRVAVVRLNPLLIQLGLQVGSTLTLEIENSRYDFQVVGLLPPAEEFNIQDNLTFGEVLLPPDSLGISPPFELTIVQVAPEQLNKVLLELSAIPLVFSLDVTFLDGLLSRFIDQLSAIPILVGLLSLGAAGVIMANTVALSTLERRRQIGILKAVGLKGRRVLRIMLLENTLVCLLGALLGVGFSGLGVALMTHFGLGDWVAVPQDAMPVAVALVIAAVFIGWLATVLSANVAVRERVLNVLRYE